MSTKQVGGQSTSRIRRPVSSKLTKQLNDQVNVNQYFTNPISTPVIDSTAEVKIEKATTPSPKQHGKIKQLGTSKFKRLKVQTAINKDFATKSINSSVEKTAPSKQYANNRFDLYSGKEKMTLRSDDLQRIRELQDANDQLKRQVASQKKELFQASDSLKLSAEIEQTMCIIARNAGEILSIYSDNESRLRRISELEERNIHLQEEMSDVLGKIAICFDMHQKTKFSKGYFLKKAEHDRNTTEIQRLK
ncbi:MAG: hypothetical protein ACRDAI_00405 [Candidatus Rhabdochlamydia sp.]